MALPVLAFVVPIFDLLVRPGDWEVLGMCRGVLGGVWARGPSRGATVYLEVVWRAMEEGGRGIE